MEVSRELQKKYGARVMFIAIVVWLVFYALAMRPFGDGFLLGSLFSVVNFALLGEALAKRMNLEGRKLKANIYGSLFLRLALMAVPLYLGIKFEKFNLIAVVIGLFMIQIMILTQHFLMALFPKRNNDENDI